MNIKINGVNISVENNSANADNYIISDVEKYSNTLSKESEDISRQLKAINLLSNVKAVESFGYKSTEGVGESIKKGILFVWQKIVNFFESIINFVKKILYKMQKLTIFKKIKASKILSNKTKSLLIDVVSKLGVLLNTATNQLEKYYVKVADIKKAKNDEELKALLTNAKLCAPGKDIDPKLASKFRIALNVYLYILNVNNAFLTYVVNVTLSNELFYQKPNIDQLRPKINSLIEDVNTNLHKYNDCLIDLNNLQGLTTEEVIKTLLDITDAAAEQFNAIQNDITNAIDVSIKEIDNYSASHSQIKTEEPNTNSENNVEQNNSPKTEEPPKVIQL